MIDTQMILNVEKNGDWVDSLIIAAMHPVAFADFDMVTSTAAMYFEEH